MAREQAHQAALLAPSARPFADPRQDSTPPPDDDALVARRIAAQRLQELEDALERARRLAREHRAEVIGLKGRIQYLESRLTQLWAHQATATAADTPSSAERHPA